MLVEGALAQGFATEHWTLPRVAGLINTASTGNRCRRSPDSPVLSGHDPPRRAPAGV